MATFACSNTYKAYKNGTRQLTAWLVETSRLCGYKLPQHVQTISSTGITTHVIPVHLYPALAKSIAAANIELPTTIESLIQNVVALRKQVNSWYRASSTANLTANDGHLHFIRILEEVKIILQPRKHEQTQTNNYSKTDDSANVVKSTVANIFELLTLEEPQEQLKPSSNKSKKALKQPQIEVYDFSTDPESQDSEIELAIFALFNDIKEIRLDIQRVWTSYKAGKINAMTAAAITNTACILLDDTLKGLDDSPISSMTHREMEQILYPYIPGDDDGAIRDVSREEYYDWLCLAPAAFLELISDCREWAANVMSDEPEVDYSENRSTMSRDGRRIDSIRTLGNFLRDIHAYWRATNSSSDEMTDAITASVMTAIPRSLDDHPQVTTTNIAIFQIYLDIQNTLREDASRPFAEFQSIADRVLTALSHFFIRKAKATHRSICDDAMNLQIRELFNLVKRSAREDKVSKFRLSCPNEAYHHPPDFRFLKTHPTLAGLMTFQILLKFNMVGIDLCDIGGTPLPMVHLYNAASKSEALPKWVDIEFIIDTHTASHLFVGAAPHKPHDYCRRLHLATGQKVSTFASDSKTQSSFDLSTADTKRARVLETQSLVRDIFFTHYVNRGKINLSKANVQRLLETAAKATQGSLPVETARSRRQRMERQPSLLEMLTSLETCIELELVHLNFDYIGFHIRNMTLFTEICDHLSGEFPTPFQSIKILARDGEHAFVAVAHHIFLAIQVGRLAPGTPGVRVLQLATEVIKRYLAKGEGDKGLKAAKLSLDIEFTPELEGALSMLSGTSKK